MKINLILALTLISTPALASDITLTLNDKEQQVLLSLLDLAVRQGGVRVAGNAAYFMDKIQPPDEKKNDTSKIQPPEKDNKPQ